MDSFDITSRRKQIDNDFSDSERDSASVSTESGTDTSTDTDGSSEEGEGDAEKENTNLAGVSISNVELETERSSTNSNTKRGISLVKKNRNYLDGKNSSKSENTIGMQFLQMSMPSNQSGNKNQQIEIQSLTEQIQQEELQWEKSQKVQDEHTAANHTAANSNLYLDQQSVTASTLTIFAATACAFNWKVWPLTSPFAAAGYLGKFMSAGKVQWMNVSISQWIAPGLGVGIPGMPTPEDLQPEEEPLSPNRRLIQAIPNSTNISSNNINASENHTNNNAINGSETDNHNANSSSTSSSSSSRWTFFEMVFPQFNPNSFIFRVSVLQMMEYLGSMMIGSRSVGGGPGPCALYLLGASWGPAIAQGWFWRTIFPMMLHWNNLHIMFNVIFQMRIAPGLEKIFGTTKFMLMYLFCGFFGNLISLIADPMKLAVGWSTSGFGLIGVWIAEIMISWQFIRDETKPKLWGWLGMMACSMALMTIVAPQLDMFGHVGGWVWGCLSVFLFDKIGANGGIVSGKGGPPEHLRPAWYDEGKRVAQKTTGLILLVGLFRLVVFGPTGPFIDCGTLLHPGVVPMPF